MKVTMEGGKYDLSCKLKFSKNMINIAFNSFNKLNKKKKTVSEAC